MAVCGVNWVICLQWVVYVPVMVAGFPLNMAALWLLLFRVRRWSESTVYLSSLVINDSLLIFSLPFKIHAYEREWGLGQSFCFILESLVYVNVYGSILLSVCISIDRYVALRFPFAAQRLRSPWKAGLVCVAVWGSLLGFSYPVYSNHKNSTNGTSFCFQNFSSHTWKKQWIVVSMEMVFCVSAVIMAFCSAQVISILRKLRRRNPNDAKLRNNKSVKIVVSNLVVFLVCFIPYHIATPLYFHFKNNELPPKSIEQLRRIVHSSLCLSSVNCLADGVCYYFILKENLQMAQRERLSSIHSPEKTQIMTGSGHGNTKTEVCEGVNKDKTDKQNIQ